MRKKISVNGYSYDDYLQLAVLVEPVPVDKSNRPRKVLEYRKPLEVFQSLVASVSHFKF